MKRILPLFAFLILSWSAFSQDLIKGTVTDGSGDPLPGATVIIKGTNNYAVTDVGGQFNIKPPKELPVTLVTSLAGYKSQEVDVYELSEESLEVVLNNDNVLDEVVVVGYGEQKRKDITGSVASLPAELKYQPVVSVERVLQGAVAGAIVTQTSGQPGGGVSVQIRGSNSVTANSDPLYVIDGFPINNDYSLTDAGITNGPKINPLSSIATSDIESVDVLKDASATAIYGSRGANGVIIITTKKGKANESAIHYDAFYGVQQVVKTLSLATAGEWWQLRKDAAFNTLSTNANAVSKLKSDNLAFLKAAKDGGYTLDTAGVGTDWQDAAYREAAIQSHTLSFLTGSDKTRIGLSANYLNQEGVIVNTDFKRYSFRFNVDHDFNDRFKVLAYINGSATTANVAPDAIVSNLLQSPAAVPIYKDNGEFLIISGLDQSLANPINSLYNQVNETNTYRLLSNVSGEYKISEALTAKVLYGTDIVLNKQNRYLPQSTQEGRQLKGQAFIGSLQTVNWLNENTLSYQKTIGDHALNTVVGFTAQRSVSEGQTSATNDFLSDFYEYHNIGLGLGTVAAQSSAWDQWSLASWLARANYGYKERYLLTLTLRADGSSKFGDDKWGYFPSAAVGWNVHEENFFQDVRNVSFLKLRASLGSTGNQSIPTQRSIAQLAGFRYNFNNQPVVGLAPINVANPGLTWEKTFQVDVGADLGLFNNRVNVVFDYYYKKTTDLLLFASVPGSSGLAEGSNVGNGQISAIYQNLGAVENRGVELSINSQNLTGAFEWSTIAVFSANRNKVLDIGNGIPRFLPNQSQPSVIEVGQPLGSFLVYETDGLIQPGEEGAGALTPQAFNGVGAQKYKDQDGDGKITQTGDRVVVKNNPGVNIGLTNRFAYKGFELSVLLQASVGGTLYNFNRAQLELNNGAGNAAKAAAYAYRVPGTRGAGDPGFTDTDVKAAYQDPAITLSDRFIEDASYLRVKNVSFGYRFPGSITSKLKLKSLRIYVSAQNYWTITNYTGYDPEASQAGQSLLTRGVDNGVYPNNKSIQGGVQLSF
ncbi:SusC/RagA family TonB-linked outer membrane protein [Pseudochryseolinea flava]|uniref:SusC/RagA family protein n=1 Tax=Pseudochryseolinea flava TaxID=2059302 RepID=A0A364XZH8_9BACT|nr:TonB-dependent receptor [Pseudochryseolinea flava]RAV99022.1 SusC/RagA family protein [Pseudochryseolinea flava]